VTVLRLILGALGLLAIAGAVLAVWFGAPFPILVVPGIMGLVCILGALFERVHYKMAMATAPGGGFVATPERFVDPTSGRVVQVHVKSATGERAYVDVGPAPPHDATNS
jgi:hypothetical protein